MNRSFSGLFGATLGFLCVKCPARPFSHSILASLALLPIAVFLAACAGDEPAFTQHSLADKQKQTTDPSPDLPDGRTVDEDPLHHGYGPGGGERRDSDDAAVSSRENRPSDEAEVAAQDASEPPAGEASVFAEVSPEQGPGGSTAESSGQVVRPTGSESTGGSGAGTGSTQGSGQGSAGGTSVVVAEKVFSQVRLAPVTDMRLQGAPGVPHEEHYAQNPAAGVIDVLVVVDDSGSMQEEQENLSERLLPLLTHVQQADWRIGVITTSFQTGVCLRGLIKKGDTDAPESFRQAILAGTGGSSNEQGVLQAMRGLECLVPVDGTEKSWLRADSSLAVLLVSDEDNCSFRGKDCEENRGHDPMELLEVMTAMGRNVSVDARVYGLIKPPGSSDCVSVPVVNPKGYNPSDNDSFDYAALIESSGGAWGSICSPDFSPVLQEISADMRSLLKNQFVLKNEPDPASVRVVARMPGGASRMIPVVQVVQNTVTLAYPLEAAEVLVVNYTTPSAPQVRVFNLTGPAAVGTVSVAVESAAGVPLMAGNWVVGSIGEAAAVTFEEAPPPGSRVLISYLSDVPLQDSFELGEVNGEAIVRVEIVQMGVNSLIKGWRVSPEGTHLIFDEAPPAGSDVHVFWLRDQGN